MMIRQNRTKERIYMRLDVNALGERQRRAWESAFRISQKPVLCS
ncbi:MAG: hypothetical protein V1766_16085 [Pseudomonadota bacterium]